MILNFKLSFLKKLSAVLFDLGDTLAVYKPSREFLFVQSAREAGLRLSPIVVKRGYEWVDFNMKYSSLQISEKEDREAFYKAYNENLCLALGISTYFNRIYPKVRRTFRTQGEWHLRKGAKKALGLLQERGLRLALVANWDINLRDQAKQLGIASCFECILSSDELGVEKPDQAIFLGALKRMGLNNKSEVLYVGNDYRSDIIGARSAGLIPCLLDADNCYPFADCLKIRQLEELPKLIPYKK